MRLWLSAVCLSFLALVPVKAKAGDTELVMFGSPGSLYCKLFNREVAPHYSWSDVGTRVPLRTVDVDASGTGGYSLKYDITVTPTFVMFDHGREVSRISGYPGKDNFYLLVGHMLENVK